GRCLSCAPSRCTPLFRSRLYCEMPRGGLFSVHPQTSLLYKKEMRDKAEVNMGKERIINPRQRPEITLLLPLHITCLLSLYISNSIISVCSILFFDVGHNSFRFILNKLLDKQF